MKRWLTILALVGSMTGFPGPSQADTVGWFAGSWLSRYANGAHLMAQMESAQSEVFGMDGQGDSNTEILLTAAWTVRGVGSLPIENMVARTDPTTLIGHLTLEEYTALAEIATVTELYITQGILTVKFLGGAWPGSLLSVFETSFLL